MRTHRRRAPDEDAVVVPAIAAGSSITCVRSLGRAGVRPIAVSTAGPQSVFRSKYCDETHYAPSPTEDLAGYRDALLDLARRPDVATIVPLRESDIYVLAKHRDEFAEHVATPWPPMEAVRRVQDWLDLREAAESLGVAAPETRPVDEWDHWDRPTIVKSRYSIVEADNQLRAPGRRFVEPGEPPDVDEFIEESGHVPIAQEFVPGDAEHGFFALLDRGDPVATFQHRRIRSYTYSGGASVYRKSVSIPSLAAAGTRLLSGLDWHGPAMAEFKRDPRDGAFKLLEINPRFWGSLALPFHAGVDFPALYYRLATGETIQPRSDYDVGLGCHLVRGEMSYLHSILRYDYDLVERPSLGRALAAIALSTVGQPHFDYLSLDDPHPFLADVLGAARSDVLEPLRRLVPAGADPGRG